MQSPPAMIDGARVLSWADTADLAKTDACILRDEHGIQISFAAVAIAQYESAAGCYLFFCDENWETQNDTDHTTFDEAQRFAETLYPGIANRWRRALK